MCVSVTDLAATYLVYVSKVKVVAFLVAFYASGAIYRSGAERILGVTPASNKSDTAPRLLHYSASFLAGLISWINYLFTGIIFVVNVLSKPLKKFHVKMHWYNTRYR